MKFFVYPVNIVYKIQLSIVFLLITVVAVSAQTGFEKYFAEQSLRIDMVFIGNSAETEVVLSDIRTEPEWGGNKNILIDPFGYGEHQVILKVLATEEVIYSRGFSSLYSEWQTTAEASTLKRAFNHSAVMPFPKVIVAMEIMERNTNGSFRKLLTLTIDPASDYIKRDKQEPVKITEILANGPADHKVDIAFIAEGYTDKESDKFVADVNRFTDYLFSRRPFSEYKESFNVNAVHALSLESGTDIPGQDIWKNTACNSSFYTFGIERYLTTFDFKSVCNYAGHVPYDVIFVIVNSSKYGGGGMYNLYSMGTADHEFSEEVFIHELGHGFAGLGDEYFSSDVAYEEFYKLDIEPWEPNLTTMVDFDSKWKDMLDPDTPVPTPDEPQYLNTTGVFEGGGYVSKGVYRPSIDCTMRNTATADEFCEVCRRSIIKMIEFYTK